MDIINCVKRDSKTFVVLTAVSESCSIPEGEYITFKAVFKDLDGNIVCKRTILPCVYGWFFTKINNIIKYYVRFFKFYKNPAFFY